MKKIKLFSVLQENYNESTLHFNSNYCSAFYSIDLQKKIEPFAEDSLYHLSEFKNDALFRIIGNSSRRGKL